MKATEQLLADLFLPPEALAAFRAGEEWEYEPDSIEGADADVYWCDDCGTWHQVWCVWGLRLDADNTLHETLTLVDSDGNWEFSDEFPYGEHDHDSDRRAMKARWREYAKWVVHNKSDPLGEFSMGSRKTVSKTYIAQFRDSIVGPKVVRVRPAKGKYVPLTDAPPDVQAYLADMKEFASLDDLRERALGIEKWLAPDKGTFTLTRFIARSTARKNATDFLSRTRNDKE
jgi:hypothetical protein